MYSFQLILLLILFSFCFLFCIENPFLWLSLSHVYIVSLLLMHSLALVSRETKLIHVQAQNVMLWSMKVWISKKKRRREFKPCTREKKNCAPNDINWHERDVISMRHKWARFSSSNSLLHHHSSSTAVSRLFCCAFFFSLIWTKIYILSITDDVMCACYLLHSFSWTNRERSAHGEKCCTLE